MLLSPQRPARSGFGTNTFGRKNSSTASFASSSNEGYDRESSRGTSESSRGFHNGYFDPRSTEISPRSSQVPTQLPNGRSSDAGFAKYATEGRHRGASSSKKLATSHDSTLTRESEVSSKSKGGTLRGLGRRLFSRSNSNLKAAPILASRSQSASSSSTGGAHSPPLTPTTPPPVQPVWLPNGQKDFFSTLSGLPSSLHVADHTIRSSRDAANHMSPKTLEGNFDDPRDSQDYNQRQASDTASSQGHGSNSSFSHHFSLFSMPSMPSATAAPPAFRNTVSRREFPAVIEEEGDSDFLRAVLNFGEGENDPSLPTPSFRGGRAAPLPTRSSSLGQIFGITSSPSGSAPASPMQPPRRTPDGRVILTQEAAREFETEQPATAYVVVRTKYRKGLFGHESESEDEYGEDDGQTVQAAAKAAAEPAPTPVRAKEVTSKPAPKEDTTRFPSSFEKARTRSPTNGANKDEIPPPRFVGLETAAKKALYNCTLLKVHMHLAPMLAGDAESRLQIPVIAAGEVLYGTEDLKFPRSVNGESKLRQHSSTSAFSWDLKVALGRTVVMRKLRSERLPIEQEVEISWFQRRYGSTSIAPEQIQKALRQRQMVSPEALAKPPIAAPLESANRRLSGVVGLEAGQKLQSPHERNGIIAWAHRPGFLERCMVMLPADEYRPGEVLVSESANATLGARVRVSSAASASSSVSFSPRIRVLAGLPSVEEERKLKYARAKKIQSRNALRAVSASDSAVWDGSVRGSVSPLGSPTNKQKRLPPWMAPRESRLLSPQSMGNLRSPRVPSDSSVNLSSPRQNQSVVPDAEGKEVKEEDGDSSDEVVPLAQLSKFRAQRAAEKERIQKLEREIAALRQKDQQREREEEERKEREEEARRLEAQHTLEERKAAMEARRMEKNRKILQEARDRRGFTRASVLLSEPNYGAGNPLLGGSRPAAKPLGSPASPQPNGGDPPSPNTKTRQHDAALAKLQGLPQASRSTATLYVQQEGQRRSRTSLLAPTPEVVVPAVPSPHLRASASFAAAPLNDGHRQNSMTPLVAQSAFHTLPHRLSMANLPVSPQISQRRTSLMPPSRADAAALHHTVSMHHLSPTSPQMLSPGGFLDPHHSMSMTNLHAQAYYAQQAQMQGLQRPAMAQTARAGARSRPPLVSLYGDVVPSSAMQRRRS